MKQRITSGQLMELSETELEKWFDWCSQKNYPTKANIGEMLDFIFSNGTTKELNINTASIANLCDLLWELCKTIL